MGDWLLMPAKVFLMGLFLAIIATFSFRSVEIPYVQQAAIVSAQTASTSSTPQATATSTVDSMTHSSANDMLTIGNNGIVTSTVSYQPPNVFSNVFNYLGVPSPNQPIVMSSSAVAKNTGIQMQSVMPNLQLYTVNGAPAVANVVSGYEEEIVGTLTFAGTPIANADITVTTSGGTIGSATANPTGGSTTMIDGNTITLATPSTSEVTSGVPSTTTLDLQTNAEGQFAFDYYAPINIGQFSVTANGANSAETVPISSTPVVTVGNIANIYVNGSTIISGNVQTSSGSPVQDEPVTLTITAPDSATQQVNTTTDSSGNFSTTYTPVQVGGYMVKAECEGGSSNLYGEIENVGYNSVTLQTNINANNASPDNSNGDAQLSNNSGWPQLSSGNPSYPITPGITYNAGDYLQANYPVPSGYQGVEAFANITDNMNGTNMGTTLYMSAVGSNPQTDIINTPYGYTSQSVNWLLPNGTTAVNLGFEYTSTNTDNGWTAFYLSQIFLAPIGSAVSGGTFDSQYVTMAEPQWPSSPMPTIGSPIMVTGQVTYNGKPVANQTVTALDFISLQPYELQPNQFNVINSSGQSVSQLTTTTDSNGEYSFTFTVPSSEPSGYYYSFDVSCDDASAGSQLIILN